MNAPKWQLPLILLCIGVVLWLLAPVLTPFVAALMLAWLGNPLVRMLERAGRSRNTAVLIVYLSTTLIILLGLLVMVAAFAASSDSVSRTFSRIDLATAPPSRTVLRPTRSLAWIWVVPS